MKLTTTIARLLARLFPRHKWAGSDDMRTCMTCQRREVYHADPHGGLWVGDIEGNGKCHWRAE